MRTISFIFIWITFFPLLVFGEITHDFTTPNGHQVRFKKIGKEFYIQWEVQDSLLTLDYCFLVDGPDAWMPRFEKENDNYLFFRAGCGSPCWIGFFLPLFKNGEPKVIHEYIAVNLDKHLVASISLDSIEIINLTTSDKQLFNPGKCESIFLGYCLDSAYFKDNILYYSWTPHTHINSSARQ